LGCRPCLPALNRTASTSQSRDHTGRGRGPSRAWRQGRPDRVGERRLDERIGG
jgi:hypothetical protein